MSIPEDPKQSRPKMDRTGKLITILPDGLVKLDGVILFRTVERDGKICLQFVDHDRLRVRCRGSRFVEIPIEILLDKVQGKEKDEKPESESPSESQ
jgi:hypothetical protein